MADTLWRRSILCGRAARGHTALHEKPIDDADRNAKRDAGLWVPAGSLPTRGVRRYF